MITKVNNPRTDLVAELQAQSADSGRLQKAVGQVGRSPVPEGPVSRDRSSQYVIRAQKESRIGGEALESV